MTWSIENFCVHVVLSPNHKTREVPDPLKISNKYVVSVDANNKLFLKELSSNTSEINLLQHH